ncbi:MAG TPA: CRISPR-associated endonuclease Cas2 [Methanoregula sp.]|nr:CRISPR-associated endonuclease Cas2 [Methanoregula sp.]
MYVIIVYDISVERVAKVCNFLRRYLVWVQNSVFEGELTDRQFTDVEYGLKKIIKKDKDSVRFYIIRSQDLVKVGNMGIEKADQCTII